QRLGGEVWLYVVSTGIECHRAVRCLQGRRIKNSRAGGSQPAAQQCDDRHPPPRMSNAHQSSTLSSTLPRTRAQTVPCNRHPVARCISEEDTVVSASGAPTRLPRSTEIAPSAMTG